MPSVRLLSLVEDIMNVPTGSLKESDTRDTVANWTSLVDVQIAMLLDAEWGISPNPEIMQAETIGDLLGKVEQLRGRTD